MFFVLSVLLLMFVSVFHIPAFAFNSDRCDREVVLSGPSHDIWGGMGHVMTSSIQFMSSWGPCSALGERETERLNFVVVNRDPLENDAARGSGEYLEALTTLYDIPKNQRDEFARSIQRNYISIFGFNNASDPEDVFDAFELHAAKFKSSAI